MIRHRLTDLGRAVARAIEMLRATKQQLEQSAPAVLELLGQAACSERATFWTIDPELGRLRATASWGTVGQNRLAPGANVRHRTSALSHGNAGHVWRSRKPMWATSMVLDTTLDRSFEAGLRGGVWFAVKTDTSVYGVVELLGRALEPKTPDNLVLVERLGARLGHALEEVRYGRRRLQH